MKDLYLRIDISLYTSEHVTTICNFFKQFFKSVTVLDIVDQKKTIQDLELNSEAKVISMDKYIPLKHNLDVSRVFDINGTYLYHNIKYNGRIAKDESVILYDHDIVGGFQIKMLTTMLESQGCDVKVHSLISLTKEEAEIIEILDLDDFINQGLVVDFGGVLRRVPYYVNPEILESRASIPTARYAEFKNGFICLMRGICNGR